MSDGLHSAPTDSPLGAEEDSRAVDARIQALLHNPALATRYQVVRKLGQGGMGALFWVKDRQLDRDAALKLMLAEDTEAVLRFEREGQALARLSHPNVLKVYSVELVDGVPVLVLELLRGTMLSSILQLLGPYGEDAAVALLAQVLEGLAVAHDAGVIHRDLKAANLLVLPDRTVKILDFGLARGTGRDRALSRTLTADGVAVGTRGYISPEQWWGSHGEPRSDLYAVGLILFELLTGNLPASLRSGTPPRLAQHDRLIEADLRAAGIPAGLVGFLKRALRADPAARFPDARAMLDALAKTRSAGRAAPPATPAAGATPADRATAPATRPRARDTRGLAMSVALACTLVASVVLPLRTPGAGAGLRAPGATSSAPSAARVEPGATSSVPSAARIEPRATPSVPSAAQVGRDPSSSVSIPERVPPGTVDLLAGLRGYGDGDLALADGALDFAVRRFRSAALAGNPYAQWLLGRMLFDGSGVVADAGEGLRWMRRAADANVPAALRGVGEACERGLGRPPDRVEAVRWYRRAAMLGSARGAAGLGALLLGGSDSAEAVRWLRAAAERGETRAILTLARAYRDGTGITKDPVEAVRWLRRGAEELDPDATYELARCALEGVGMPRDDGAAFTLAAMAASSSDDAALLQGDLLVEGRGTARDVPQALDVYAIAARRGSDAARVRMARLYLRGRGIPADSGLAVHHLETAAARGDAEAAAELAWCCERGVSGRGDAAAAARWCRAACEHRNANALAHLGLMYLEGRTVRADPAEAIRYLREAAQGGSALGAWRLGACYRTGRGVGRDPHEAVRWFRAAADGDLHEAQLEMAAACGVGEGTARDTGEAQRWCERAARTPADRLTWPTHEEEDRSYELERIAALSVPQAPRVPAASAASLEIARDYADGVQLYERARSQIERGEAGHEELLARAIPLLERAAEAKYETAHALYYAGAARLARGDSARGDVAAAADLLRRSLALDRSVMTLAELSQAEGVAGDTRAQCAHIEEVVAQLPGWPVAHTHLAMALDAGGDPAEIPRVVDHARIAMRGDPGAERLLRSALHSPAALAALWPLTAERAGAAGIALLPARQLHWMTQVDGDDHLQPLLRAARNPEVLDAVARLAPDPVVDAQALWRAAEAEPDEVEAAWLLRRAAASGEFDPLVALARRVRAGRGTSPDPELARTLIDRALGSSEAWAALGPSARRTGLERQVAELEHQLHRATPADAGWRVGRVVACTLAPATSPDQRALLTLRVTVSNGTAEPVARSLCDYRLVDARAARLRGFRNLRQSLLDPQRRELEVTLPLLADERTVPPPATFVLDWQTIDVPAPLPGDAPLEARAAGGDAAAEADLAARLIDANDFAKGMQWARRAALHGNETGKHLLAICLVSLDLYRDQAEALVRQLLVARPANWNVRFLAATLHDRRGALHAALAQAKEAERLDPGNASIHGLLSWIYSRLGQRDQAEEEARQSRITPRPPR